MMHESKRSKEEVAMLQNLRKPILE